MPSEREKMLAGELYRASDPELARARLRAQQILMRYNATQPIELDLRSSILTELFASLGHNSEVKPHFACDYGLNIQLGRNVFVNYGCVFLDCGLIVLGDDVQIGPAVQIYTATHPIDPVVRRTGLEAARPVRIGSNVWIGGAAVVLPGVTIGDDAVIGAAA